jgi:ABC-type phosphate/phosphonate transport system permease subunit
MLHVTCDFKTLYPSIPRSMVYDQSGYFPSRRFIISCRHIPCVLVALTASALDSPQAPCPDPDPGARC